MKKSFLKYLLLIIPFGLFTTRLFAQTPADPGDDPMKADTAKNIIALKPVANIQLTSYPGFLAEGKGSVFINNKSDSLYSGKKEEEDTHMIF